MQSPDQVAIKEELERILSSKVFRKSPALSSFLKYVVNETIEGKVDEIKEYSIAVKALGKPADFNPQIDAMIRIHAGRLRRSLLEYYTAEGNADPILILLNRGSYVPEFSLRENKSADSKSELTTDSQPKTTSNRIAVLPFKNLSGLADNDFLVDGFCEQLSSDLAQFPEIEVIAYFSTSRFRDEKPDIRLVGAELGTSHLITGSLYRDKKRLRISMQLISASSGAQLWTESFEHAVQSSYLYDIFNDIIKQVVPKLSGYYGIINRTNSLSTQLNPQVHSDTIDAVFWYYHYQIRYTEETFQIARIRIENALQQNPDYALGWAMLAQLYIDGGALCYVTVEDPLTEANKCIKKALQLDKDCQHAWLSLTWMYIFLREKNNAVKSMQKCISINNRSSFFLAFACFLYGLQGEYELSMEYFEKTNILNPYYPWWVNIGPIMMNFYNCNYEEALEFANLINIPGVFWNHIFKISALGQLQRIEEAREEVNRFQKQFPGKAVAASAILQVALFHESVYERIKEGLNKAGLPV
jgi:TolB-like protein